MNPTPPPPLPPGASFLPPQPPPPPPPTSLNTALAELTSLIALAEATVRSIPAQITTATSDDFVLCPFNPNHRVPPSSLFSHYLNCPSPVSLPHTFQYPLTLHSSSNSTKPPPTPPADSSDLIVSLNNHITYNSPSNSFFYQNCPGPVTLTGSVQLPPPVSLPRVLYIECSDFNIDSSLKGVMNFPIDFIKLLPSEIWAIQSEIEAWGGGFPACYSSRILCAVLKLRDCGLLHLYDWIIANSPRYGVIIDLAMRDHAVALVKLCLKAIVRETFELTGVKHGDGEMETENSFPPLRNRSFACPVLVKAMTWLASQFSILCGEVYGKFFAVDVLKECILDSASRASLFPLDGKDAELSNKEKVERDVEEPVQSVESIDGTKRAERETKKSETVGNSFIFISEVAAAVAALHERLLIEEKIKALRNPQPLSAFKRYMEHAHFSNLADEERQRRADYKPIIDHDGFLGQRSNTQEVNKVKTREELLAEERDYKRRRMSYRGKKQKRSTLEVMRGIIEEYTEEMRQAGGFCGTSKAMEAEASASENLVRQTSAAFVSGSRRNSETPEESSSHSNDYRKDLHSRLYSGDFKDDNQQPGHDSTFDHWHKYPNRIVDSVRYDKDDRSGSQDSYSRRPHQRTNEGQDGKYYKSRDEHERRGHKRGRDEHERSGRKRERDEDYWEHGNTGRSNTKSASRERNEDEEGHEGQDGKYYKSRDEHERRGHKRGRDEHERSGRKRERDEDYWEHGNTGRSNTKSASRERNEDEEGHDGRRKSKTNQTSSSHYELHEFEDRYDPAVSHD